VIAYEPALVLIDEEVKTPPAPPPPAPVPFPLNPPPAPAPAITKVSIILDPLLTTKLEVEVNV
jgi:hypothetical protein